MTQYVVEEAVMPLDSLIQPDLYFLNWYTVYENSKLRVMTLKEMKYWGKKNFMRILVKSLNEIAFLGSLIGITNNPIVVSKEFFKTIMIPKIEFPDDDIIIA